MVSEAQNRANAKYVKEKVKTYTVKFYPTEQDIYEHLHNQSNKAGYIKNLIRKDMGVDN